MKVVLLLKMNEHEQAVYICREEEGKLHNRNNRVSCDADLVYLLIPSRKLGCTYHVQGDSSILCMCFVRSRNTIAITDLLSLNNTGGESTTSKASSK